MIIKKKIYQLNNCEKYDIIYFVKSGEEYVE